MGARYIIFDGEKIFVYENDSFLGGFVKSQILLKAKIKLEITVFLEKRLSTENIPQPGFAFQYDLENPGFAKNRTNDFLFFPQVEEKKQFLIILNTRKRRDR